MFNASRHLATATIIALVLAFLTGTPVSGSAPLADPWIVYEGPIPDGAGIRLVRPDGTGDHWATSDVPRPDGGWQVHPDWRRDGRRLAFAADDADGSGTRDLWVADADGAHARRVLDCREPCNQADAPAWSPDGRLLAFAAYDADADGVMNGRVDVLDLATGRVRTIANASDDLHDFMWPRWSPDGRRLVVEVQTWTDRSFAADLVGTTIAIVDAGGHRGLRLVPGVPAWSTYPDWSPGADVIVFFNQPLEAGEAVATNLYLVRPDGTKLRAVTSYALGEERPVQPTWTPDGHRIIFSLARADFSEPRMMTIGPDGVGLAPATASGPVFGTHARLRPPVRRR